MLNFTVLQKELKFCDVILNKVLKEAMHLQCFTPTHYVMGVATRTYKRDDHYQIVLLVPTMHVAIKLEYLEGYAVDMVENLERN